MKFGKILKLICLILIISVWTLSFSEDYQPNWEGVGLNNSIEQFENLGFKLKRFKEVFSKPDNISIYKRKNGNKCYLNTWAYVIKDSKQIVMMKYEYVNWLHHCKVKNPEFLTNELKNQFGKPSRSSYSIAKTPCLVKTTPSFYNEFNYLFWEFEDFKIVLIDGSRSKYSRYTGSKEVNCLDVYIYKKGKSLKLCEQLLDDIYDKHTQPLSK